MKNLNKPNRPSPWSILDIGGGRDEEEVLEDLADFFNEISSEFVGLDITDIPVTYDRPIYPITEGMIESKIKNIKKPKSTVPGDIPPSIVNEVAAVCAIPLCHIYNEMPTTEWPRSWKKEFQTIIPKKNSPDNANECRNLSCTNLFSKVLETFVLESIQSEIDTSSLQYGGIKGSGVNHFLVHMWNEILPVSYTHLTLPTILLV